ncbi:hypothetical protein G6F68_014614 [Rhizopus microsporus]|nr:hypothetical protein G6F68_014614 [Rhizopus microsporus]
MLVEFRPGQRRVRLALAGLLAVAATDHPLLNRAGGLAGRTAHGFGVGWRQRHVQVDAVQQGARNLSRITRHLVRRANAGAPRVPAPAARARVHGGDQLKAGGELGGMQGTGDDHPARLKRLA